MLRGSIISIRVSDEILRVEVQVQPDNDAVWRPTSRFFFDVDNTESHRSMLRVGQAITLAVGVVAP
ncbi:MAG: hypothetical protein AAB706_03370 [Patescibacteria group bacterium]